MMGQAPNPCPPESKVWVVSSVPCSSHQPRVGNQYLTCVQSDFSTELTVSVNYILDFEDFTEKEECKMSLTFKNIDYMLNR